MSKLDQIKKLVTDVLETHRETLMREAQFFLERELEIYKAPGVVAELDKKMLDLDKGLLSVDWNDEAKAMHAARLRARDLSQADYLKAVVDYRAAQAKVFECEDAMTYVQRTFDLAKLEAGS